MTLLTKVWIQFLMRIQDARQQTDVGSCWDSGDFGASTDDDGGL